ncbi:hypothetical protein Amac_025120 [Acrocarpospora macrocephala]|uniref:Uncharacterized protein n=1 Tax=Acrocarpospora macrocephala TaxID=150177 RepID=A0A5M3WJV5_9ACTN|nr:hypothetical protein Amac_025120 [Acrocarpospora macrocephala]
MGRLPLRVDTRRLKADTPHPKAGTRRLVDISNSSLVISNSLVDISSSSPVISSLALTRRLVDTRPPAPTTRRWACHSRRESRRHLPSGGSVWWHA